MALVEMLMPKMGESIMEATVLTWLKKEGDQIEQDESVLEVATDKVDTEVPATHGGILKEILAKEGDVVPVGKPIAVIATDGEDTAAESAPAPEKAAPPKPEPKPEPVLATASVDTVSSNGSNGQKSDRFYSPLVKNIAKKEQIPLSELDTLTGSGKKGRVTKVDILAYVEKRKSGSYAQPALQDSPGISITPSGEDEIIEMDRMRKMIAERMVESKRISPHVTSFVEADVTNIVNWRNKYKDDFKRREGENLTFTPIMIEAVVQAIKDFPLINIQVDGSRIIRKKDINIGMAVALPSGNLIVPVIHQADQYSLKGLSKKVNDLAIRARENQLKPDDLAGGTYSVSNVGSFGNVMGTPIIVQPQVAIMALGAIRKKVSVIETSTGDAIGIRHKMFLSHSYDHRVVDGALGGMFVRKVADYLEGFNTSRTI